MTVIDGDFPPEILGRENLKFAAYKMPARRNRPEVYDAKLMGPAPKKQGVLQVGALTPTDAPAGSLSGVAWLFPALATVLVGLTIARRRKRKSAATTRLMLLALLIGAGCASVATAQRQPLLVAQEPTIRQLVNDLSDPKKAEAAIDALVARGKEATAQLSGEAIEGNDITRRGWAIVCLAEIGGDDVDQLLTKVHNDPKQPMLVRTWAAAARVDMTDSTEGLIEKAALVASFPALGRPVGKRLLARLHAGDEPISAEGILSISLQIPQLQQALAPVILGQGAKKLAAVMATAKDQNVRRQAAAYLGALAGRGDKDVPGAVVAVYRFDPKAKDVAWKNGPLFVPGIQWTKEDGRALVGNLIAWHLWCDRHSRAAEQTQIHNNIRSLALAGAVGYQSPGWQDVGTLKWLTIWGKAAGREELLRMLKQQGVDTDRKYSGVLENL